MKQFLPPLLFFFLLIGCSPLTSQNQKPPATSKPGYFEMAAGVVEVPLDSDWNDQYRQDSRGWQNRRLGSLLLREVAVSPLASKWPEWRKLLESNAGLAEFGAQLRFLRDQPRYASRMKELDTWVRLRQRAKLQAWVAQEEKAWASDHFSDLLRMRFQMEGLVRFPQAASDNLTQVDGCPAIVTTVSNGQSILQGIYILRTPQLLAIEWHSDRRDTQQEAQAWFASLPSRVKLNAQVSDPALLAKPIPSKPIQEVQSKPLPQERKLNLDRPLLVWGVKGLLALLLFFPAYSGAKQGYEQAAQEGKNPATLAALTAGSYTFKTYSMIVLLLGLVILVMAASYNNNAGIMSLLTAGVLVVILGTLYAFFFIACASLMAGLGAFLGAQWGPRWAGWLAVLGALLGLGLTPNMLQVLGSQTKSRRHSLQLRLEDLPQKPLASLCAPSAAHPSAVNDPGFQ